MSDILGSRIAKGDKEMTKDEALKLALEALEGNCTNPVADPEQATKEDAAISAIKEALAEPEQEPVAWYDKHGMITHDPFEGVIPLYTAPPKREWIGLTDEEMSALKQKSVDDGMTRLVSDFEYIRSIEAKLKEKNR